MKKFLKINLVIIIFISLLFCRCIINNSQPIIDPHISDFAYEYYAHHTFKYSLDELLDYHNVGGIIAGIVYSVPEDFNSIPTKTEKQNLRHFLVDLDKCLENFTKSIQLSDQPVLSDDQTKLFISVEGVCEEDESTILLSKYSKFIKVVGLIHNFSNEYGTSSYDFKKKQNGLTEKGKILINKLFEREKIVDVSHCSKKSFDQILDIQKKYSLPVIASHSAVRGLVNNPRNLSGEQIIELAKTGGGIGVIFHMPYIKYDNTKSDLENIVGHIKYIKDLVGIEYVFIGSDYCDGIRKPRDIKQLSDIKKIIDQLKNAGFSKYEIDQVCYKNVERIISMRKFSKGN